MTETVNAKLTDRKSHLKHLARIAAVLCVSLLIWQGLRTLIMWKRMVKPGPTWNGITVGKSTSTDVVTVWGAPTSIESAGETITYSYQMGNDDLYQHQIVMRQDIVELMVENMICYFPEEITLADFIARYGKPDSVQWAFDAWDWSTKVVIFVDDGIFVRSQEQTNLNEANLIAAYYYRPRPLRAMLHDFPQYIDRKGPKTSCSGTECWYYGPRDPWYGWFGGPWPEWALKVFYPNPYD